MKAISFDLYHISFIVLNCDGIYDFLSDSYFIHAPLLPISLLGELENAQKIFYKTTDAPKYTKSENFDLDVAINVMRSGLFSPELNDICKKIKDIDDEDSVELILMLNDYKHLDLTKNTLGKIDI